MTCLALEDARCLCKAIRLEQLWEANLRLTRVAPFKEAEEDDIDPDMEDGDYGQDEGGYDMPDDQQEYQQQYGLDANGNGAYYGGLKGGSVITMRLRGGVVSTVDQGLKKRKSASNDPYLQLSEDDDEEFEDEGEDEEDVKPFDTNGKLDAGQVAEYNKLAKLGDEDVSDAASPSAKPTRDARGALLTRNPEVKPNENGIYPGEEIIGSDLDDSDQDEEDGPYDDEDEEEQDDLAKDVMICVCDKVCWEGKRITGMILFVGLIYRMSSGSASEKQVEGHVQRRVHSSERQGIRFFTLHWVSLPATPKQCHDAKLSF